jgi:hypothetical protein
MRNVLCLLPISAGLLIVGCGPTPTPTPAPTGAPVRTAPPTAAPVSFNASRVPIGYYSCMTSSISSRDGWSSSSAGSISLNADGTYAEGLQGSFGGRWSSAANRITFVGGSLDTTVTGRHDHGTYVPGGTPLPHSTLNDGPVYTVVLEGNPGTGIVNPPVTETDTPYTNNTFWYCKFRNGF